MLKLRQTFLGIEDGFAFKILKSDFKLEELKLLLNLLLYDSWIQRFIDRKFRKAKAKIFRIYAEISLDMRVILHDLAEYFKVKVNYVAKRVILEEQFFVDFPGENSDAICFLAFQLFQMVPYEKIRHFIISKECDDEEIFSIYANQEEISLFAHKKIFKKFRKFLEEHNIVIENKW